MNPSILSIVRRLLIKDAIMLGLLRLRLAKSAKAYLAGMGEVNG